MGHQPRPRPNQQLRRKVERHDLGHHQREQRRHPAASGAQFEHVGAAMRRPDVLPEALVTALGKLGVVERRNAPVVGSNLTLEPIVRKRTIDERLGRASAFVRASLATTGATERTAMSRGERKAGAIEPPIAMTMPRRRRTC